MDGPERPTPPESGRLGGAWLARARLALENAMSDAEGEARIARGAAAGTFAAMVPAFGLHLALAIAAAFEVRASRAAAVAVCLVVGNPLTHAVLVPAGFALGREVVLALGGPPPTSGLPGWLPGWIAAGLPAAEEALLGANPP